MTTCTLLLALALTLLPGPAWSRPQGSNNRINTLRMIGRNMKEARVNLRLAINMERELRKAAIDETSALREEQEVVRAGAGMGKRRRPFGPWAGR